MPKVPDHVLDEIRARLPVSQVVGRVYKLRKQGAEHVAVEDPSLTVNDGKRIWWDHGHRNDGGDVFDFEVKVNGRTFTDAVEMLASEAGVRLDDSIGAPAHHGRRGDHQAEGREGPVRREGEGGEPPRQEGARRDSPQGRKTIVATWDYVDPAGSPYQVVRSQWLLPDGSYDRNRAGKVRKTFQQRRPSPDGDGSWVWGLDVQDEETGQPIEFMKYRDGWLRYDEARFNEWRLTERRRWPGVPNVRHWLLRASDVADELRQPPDDQRTIFLPEGEGKADVLQAWGLLATTNSGGAGNWRPEHAELFRGAADVVVLVDNDLAGRERLAKVGASLRAVGARVRALNFKDVWPACPDKGDVKDWRDDGGTRDGLLEIVDRLPPWTPEPYRSRFGAKVSADLNTPTKPYPWRIKGIVPLNDSFLIMGPSQSGKTFETLDMVMHICTSRPTFAGRKVVPGGVVYLAYEGTSGFENRVRAYMKHNGLKHDDLHSFAWMTRPPNLFSDDANVPLLAAEIREVAKAFVLPLGVIVIDTHNASTRGASEVKSDEIGKILNHHAMIARETGVMPWLIGHTNSEGKHRGNEQLFNTIETTMLIERLHENNDPRKPERKDGEGRVIRRARMKKQRDGSDDVHWDFVLRRVEIGVDEDGEPIPSMVSVEPATTGAAAANDRSERREKPKGFELTPIETAIFKAMQKALDEHGDAPHASLKLPFSVGRVVAWSDVSAVYRGATPGDDSKEHKNKLKSQLARFSRQMANFNIIGVEQVVVKPANPETGADAVHRHYVWPTGKRVHGDNLLWPPMPAEKRRDDEDPIVDQATGRPITGDDFEGKF